MLNLFSFDENIKSEEEVNQIETVSTKKKVDKKEEETKRNSLSNTCK